MLEQRRFYDAGKGVFTGGASSEPAFDHKQHGCESKPFWPQEVKVSQKLTHVTLALSWPTKD